MTYAGVMRHAMLEASTGIAVAVTVAVAGCTTTPGPSSAGCAPERSTTKLVAYVPPACDAQAGPCYDDYPPDVDQAGHTVDPISSPFCQRHCAQFQSLVFTGCALSSLTDAGGKIVDCIPAGCE